MIITIIIFWTKIAMF